MRDHAGGRLYHHASAGNNGAISPTARWRGYGANQTFDFTSAANYHVATVTVDATPVTVAASYTFATVTANTPSTSSSRSTLTPSRLRPARTARSSEGAMVVNHGADQTFDFTPAPEHEVGFGDVDGVRSPPPRATPSPT